MALTFALVERNETQTDSILNDTVTQDVQQTIDLRTFSKVDSDSTLQYTLKPGEFSKDLYDQLMAIFSVVACIINIVSLCALGHMRRPCTVFHGLIINLGLSDFMLDFMVMLMHMDTICRMFYPQAEACHNPILLCVTEVVLKHASYLSIMLPLLATSLLIFNQYITVSRPLQHPNILTPVRLTFCVLVFWLLPWIVGGSLFAIYNSHDPWGEHNFKLSSGENYQYFCFNETLNYIVTKSYVLAILFSLVVLFDLIFYIKLHQSVSPNNRSLSRREIRHHSKLNITIALLAGTMVFFWVPSIVHAFLYAKRWHTVTEKNVGRVFGLMILVNTLSDPVIYGVRLSDVRAGYRRMFHCLCCTYQRIPSSNSGHGLCCKLVSVAENFTGVDPSASNTSNSCSSSGNSARMDHSVQSTSV